MARIIALMVVAVLAASPAAAPAAAAPDPTQSQQQPVDDRSIGGREALLMGAGIVALIGGIWFVIARDAKRATGGRASAAKRTPDRSSTRASRAGRRLSAAERRRRRRGRATK